MNDRAGDVAPIPPLPAARGFESTGRAIISPRYEDITQDGRYVLTAMTQGLGAVWRTMLGEDSAAQKAMGRFREQGILPILRRMIVHGEQGPFAVHSPIEFEGTWRLARERGGERIFVNMWLEARAPHGTPFEAPPPSDAPRHVVGRVFAEHVVTRPFAAASERKVTRLDAPGVPPVPEDEHDFESAEALLEGQALTQTNDVRFGMMHTDSNQHVNSLVYPRVFEETLIAREASGGRLARALDIRWRKPFFAGERAHVLCSAPDRAVTYGAFSPALDPSKPSCTIAMRMG